MNLLAAMPPEASVMGVYDGASRLAVDSVWLSKSGYVLFAEKHDYLYYEEDFPPDEAMPNIDRRN
jgi:hypothetical protein